MSKANDEVAKSVPLLPHPNTVKRHEVPLDLDKVKKHAVPLYLHKGMFLDLGFPPYGIRVDS